MAIDTTVGGIDANSYVSELEADAYFENRLHSDLWADFEKKEQALITATKLLERYVVWNCSKVDSSQTLTFPAYDAYDRYGTLLSRSTIPIQIKEATYELAYSILEEDRTVESDMAGLKSIKVGSLALEATQGEHKSVIPLSVYQIIEGLGTMERTSMRQVCVELNRG